MQVQSSARVYQQRYDDDLQPWNVRAPAPVLDEPIAEYRARLAIKAKRLLPEDHELRKVTYRRLDTAVFDRFEPQLLDAVQKAAYDASTVLPGQFREVVERDRNGHRMTRFIGPQSFVREMGRPGRRVVSFLTPFGRVNSSGMPVR
jgi:hypothetical protein